MATETDCTECDEQQEEALFAVLGEDEAVLDTEAPDTRGTKVTKWGPILLAPIGKPTGDKRRFASGALTNRDLPVALKWQRLDGQGHGGSSVIGTVDGIVYDDDGAPHGFGILFDPDPEQLPRLAEDCREARTLWEAGTLGPSVDLDDMEFHTLGDEGQYAAGERPEIEVTRGRISAVTLVQIPAFAEAGGPAVLTAMDPQDYADELSAHQEALTAAVRSSGWADMPLADPGTKWDGAAAAKRVKAWAGDDMAKYARAFLWAGDGSDQNVTAYKFPIADVIGGDLKIVPAGVSAAMAVLSGGRSGTTIPGPDQARMRGILASVRKRYDQDQDGDDDRSRNTDTDHDNYSSLVQEAMVAAAALNVVDQGQAVMPAAWFEDPKLDEPTAIKVTPDGRVFGHLATWRTCHTGIPNACTTAPKSRSNYAYFHTGAVDTDRGEVAVGRISMGGGHADTRWGFQAAAEHYDHTSTQAAVVRAGEDRHGIWVAGAALPGTDLAALKRSPLSGDWRRIGGNLELVHALAVNAPGFPVVRAAMVAGAQQALVAAGVLQPEVSTPSGAAPTFDVNAMVMEAVRTARAVEARFAKASAALATMDDQDADDAKAKARKLRALRAAGKLARKGRPVLSDGAVQGGKGVIMSERGGS